MQPITLHSNLERENAECFDEMANDATGRKTGYQHEAGALSAELPALINRI
jgi:hypothetical protein